MKSVLQQLTFDVADFNRYSVVRYGTKLGPEVFKRVALHSGNSIVTGGDSGALWNEEDKVCWLKQLEFLTHFGSELVKVKGGGGGGGSVAKFPDTGESNNSNFKLTLGSTGKVGGELVSV